MKERVVYILILLLYACSGNERDDKIHSPVVPHRDHVSYPLSSNIDSLRAFLSLDIADTDHIRVLNLFSWKFRRNNPDTAILLTQQALLLCDSVGKMTGDTNSRQLRIAKAKAFTHLGVYYRIKGDLVRALENALEGLRIDEELENTDGLMDDYSNLGVIYYAQEDLHKAHEYYKRALHLDETDSNERGIAVDLANIGIVFSEWADSAREKGNFKLATDSFYPVALRYFEKAKSLDERTKNKASVGQHMANIGSIYSNLGEYGKAMQYFKQALALAISRKDRFSESMVRGEIGLILMRQKKFSTAYEELHRAWFLADSIGSRSLLSKRFLWMSELYEKSDLLLPGHRGQAVNSFENMRMEAIHCYRAYDSISDSLLSEKNRKQLVRKEMTYEFDRKTAATKAEQDKKEALAKEELKRKETERNYFIAGFTLVLLLAGFIFRGYRQKKKANEIIIHQKHLVEEKQKEILDSIHYAKRIQDSLLPSGNYIRKKLDELK